MTGQSQTLLASGLYALINLDGAPVDPADARLLGLPPVNGPVTAVARDEAQPMAVHQRVSPTEVALFAGFLDEPEDLAASLGLSRQADQLSIALAAWARHGADMPYHALGEWSLLHWRAEHGLVLVSSMPRRDRICIARVGNRLAIAPGVWQLARLPWVGQEIDELGLTFGIMPFQVRQEGGLRTALRHVRQLPYGASLEISADSERYARSRSWRSFEAQPWCGSQRDAVAAAEDLLLHSMRQRVDRGGRPGALLSGGLDSSLAVWLLAETLGRDHPFPCITSQAPKGSGIADELAKAQLVGETLGLPVHAILPPEDYSPYQLSMDQIIVGNGVIQSPRHYLYRSFAETAVGLGVNEIYDGMYGEHTVTARYPLDTWGLRLRQMLRRLRGQRPAFHDRRTDSLVRLAPHRLANMPAEVAEAQLDNKEPPYRFPRPGERWLFVPGDVIRLGNPSEQLPGQLRTNYPFRDIRLWRLFMGFPTEFALMDDGLVRAPVRMMLKGRLPESIRMQPKGLGISPDYFARLQRHAPAQLDRIALMRQAGVDDWIDLDWLDTALRRVAAQGTINAEDAAEVQMTAMNAELLLWRMNGMAD